MAYNLALLNVARLLAPLHAPQLAEFVANLDPINALADAAPGFVWRHQDDTGNATAARLPGEDDLLLNLAVWESLAALNAYVYGGPHLEIMRKRRQFFERMDEPYLVLWWVPAGHLPDLAEAGARLAKLRAEGPTVDAFTMKDPFTPGPGSPPP